MGDTAPPACGRLTRAELDELRPLIGDKAYWRLLSQKGFYYDPLAQHQEER